MKKKPTAAQIKKFIAHVKGVALFYAVKQGQEPPDRDLVDVMLWLEEESDE